MKQKSFWVAVLLLATSTFAFAQPRDNDHVWVGGKDYNCQIMKETYSGITFLVDGKIKHEEKWQDVDKDDRGEPKAQYGITPFPIRRGKEEMAKGNYKEALIQFDKFLSERQTDDRFLQYALFHKGDCLLGLKQLDAASKVFEELRSKVPDTKFRDQIYFRLYDCVQDPAKKMDLLRSMEQLGIGGNEVPLRKADLMMKQGREKWADALGVYARLAKEAKEPNLVERATLGEFRCLILLEEYGRLRSRAEEVIRNAEASSLALAAAYNAQGAALLKDGGNEEALTAFLRNTTQFRGFIGNWEYEYALQGAARAAARVAVSAKSEDKKKKYKALAEKTREDLVHLNRTSSYLKQVEQDIAAIK